jgi:hypothetical protein
VEKILDRAVEFKVTLNARSARSNIEFEANEKEIELIKANLGYSILIKEDDRWLPSI